MGRRRKVHKNIIEVLKKSDKPLGWSEIKRKYDKKFKKKKGISPPVLTENLKHLMNQGLVEQIKNCYQLTKSYFVSQSKKEIIKHIEKVSNIDKNYLGSPALHLGTDLNYICDDRQICKKLDELFGKASGSIDRAVKMNFAFHAYKLFMKENLFTKQEKRDIRKLLGSLVWIDYKLSDLKSSDPIRKERKLLESSHWAAKEYFNRFENLTKMIDFYRGWSDLDENWYPSLSKVFEFLSLDKLMGDDENTRIYLIQCISILIPYLVDRDITNQIRGTVEEAKNYFDKHLNLFKRFMKELNSIKFMILLHFGIPDLEKCWDNLIVEDFEKWKTELRAGKFDDNNHLFQEGLQAVELTIRHLRRSKSKMPENVGVGGSWTLLELWRLHPRGKNIELYEEIYKLIHERRTLINSDKFRGRPSY